MPDGTIRVKQLYNSIVLETDDGQRMAVCFRDGIFEFGFSKTPRTDEYVWYRAGNGVVEREGYKSYVSDDFMNALKNGDHLKDADGNISDDVKRAVEIAQQFPFTVETCGQLVEVSQYQKEGFTECGAAATNYTDGKFLCEIHARGKK